MTKYIGVDLGKESFDGYCPDLGNRQFSNDATGFKVFCKWIGDSVHVVMEASGPYYLQLATYLHESGIRVSVVNPLVIRRFCQMKLQRAKTDSKDAIAIFQFAQMTNPHVWVPAPAHLQQMLQMQAVMEQLRKQLTATNNIMRSFDHHPTVDERAVKSLRRVAEEQQHQIQELEKQIMELTKKNYQAEFDALVSIPGIGNKTATILITATNAFTRFQTAKQLVAYAGLAPRIFQSGKSINKKPKISKLGMSDLRRSLFMCAFQAIKNNTGCRNLYERLRAKGKAAKIALIAVSHKLLRQAFALVKNNTRYVAELSLG